MIIEIMKNELNLDLNMLEESNIKTIAKNTGDCKRKTNLNNNMQEAIQTLKL